MNPTALEACDKAFSDGIAVSMSKDLWEKNKAELTNAGYYAELSGNTVRVKKSLME